MNLGNFGKGRQICRIEITNVKYKLGYGLNGRHRKPLSVTRVAGFHTALQNRGCHDEFGIGYILFDCLSFERWRQDSRVSEPNSGILATRLPTRPEGERWVKDRYF